MQVTEPGDSTLCLQWAVHSACMLMPAWHVAGQAGAGGGCQGGAYQVA